ncbi:MAG: hypothetical protein P4L76_09235, partial [Beijerinckiaceae bacterium]|nr:hypothetical protein [Beijerinckiaceae bacterium]
RQDPHGKIDVQRVSDALGLAALSAECGAIRLDSLDLSEGRLILALKNMNATEGVRIGISDVRDCVTVADLATRIDATIGRHIDAPPYPTGGEADLPRVALAPETMRHADLAAISYSLMHGRNAMHERLAVVTGCKTALMAKLHSFLKDPFAAPPGLVRGSVLSLQSATKPELAADEAAVTAQSLENWAHYWVSNRDAKLCWRDCHRERNPPRVPLPAYPFELKRIWYTARDRSRPTACASTETDPVIASAEFTAASLTESPASISKAPSVGLSTAPIALGRLLDHLSATRGDRPIHLSRVEFAQPFASNGAGLICRVGRRGQTDVVQCLDAEDSSGHVLVQAHLGAAIADTPYKGRKERPEMRMLPPLELYNAAERVGARVAPDFRCIEAAEATSKELAMKVTLSRLPGNDTAFWHALLSSILTGGAFLRASIFGQSPHASDLHLYRVSMLTFDPSATAIADIAIEHSDNDGSLHVRVRGVDGRCVLELRGLRLREGQTNQGRLAPAATPASRAALAS